MCRRVIEASICTRETSVAEFAGRIMDNQAMKLTDNGPPTLARQLFLTTIMLVLLAAGSAQAAQTPPFTKNQTVARRATTRPKASLAGLAKRLPLGNAKTKPLRTPAPFQRMGS
jgi:hypothetical protein